MRYRKLPVVIDAMQLTADNAAEVVQWIEDSGTTRPAWCAPRGEVGIRTLEGVMTAIPGDFIIRGVQGEHYPCKSDIFAATYEQVADDPVSEMPDGEAP